MKKMRKRLKYFSEEQVPNLFFRVGVKRRICRKMTSYQKAEIFKTYSLGKLFALDDVVMLTEKDEAFYHEMLVHPAMFLHRWPSDILIIGGGDGGTLREVLRHRPVDKALMVEIDGGVVEVCKKYLPRINQGAFADKRTDLLILDGAKFLKETKSKFDIILVDSTDPIGPGKILFSRPFYQAARRALNKGGLFACQSGSPFYQGAVLRQSYLKLKKIFPWVKVYLGFIPAYPGGLWSFCLAGVSAYDISRPIKLPFSTKFYNSQIHQAAFKLPQFVENLLCR
ncbi:MAG: polyamine aminopropyltransferase [Candidatus Ratteibacteria bacterium]|nr:polyamine aminopropyltransferase [Candidatus Ratteibacteria bacterium]